MEYEKKITRCPKCTKGEIKSTYKKRKNNIVEKIKRCTHCNKRSAHGKEVLFHKQK